MALVYSRQILSGSTNGRPVPVIETASPGTTIHTVQATATGDREEVILAAMNTATLDRQLTVEFGGTATTDHIVNNIPAQSGLYYVTPRLSLTATSSVIRAFGTATGGISVAGYVNRAT